MADYVIAGTVEWVSGDKGSGTAGANITQGDWLYQDITDLDAGNIGKLKPGAKTTTTTAALVGVALHDALDDQPITYAKPGAVVDMGSTALIVGDLYVLTTAGAMARAGELAAWPSPLSSADIITHCCYATAADRAVVLCTKTGAAVP
jgi:hypothetical protein